MNAPPNGRAYTPEKKVKHEIFGPVSRAWFGSLPAGRLALSQGRSRGWPGLPGGSIDTTSVINSVEGALSFPLES